MCNVQSPNLWNLYRQEEEQQREGEGAGEDQCTPTEYNRRLRATQSPNSDGSKSLD